MALAKLNKTAGRPTGWAGQSRQIMERTGGEGDLELEQDQESNGRCQRNRRPDQLVIEFAFPQGPPANPEHGPRVNGNYGALLPQKRPP